MNEIVKYNWNKLFENTNIKIPNIIDIIDINKVKLNTIYQNNYFSKHNEYNFFGVITLCYFENAYYLVDGHNLFYVMKKLYQDKGIDYNCNVEIINALSIDEVNEYYKKVLLINKKNMKEEKKNLFNLNLFNSEMVYW